MNFGNLNKKKRGNNPNLAMLGNLKIKIQCGGEEEEGETGRKRWRVRNNQDFMKVSNLKWKKKKIRAASTFRKKDARRREEQP